MSTVSVGAGDAPAEGSSQLTEGKTCTVEAGLIVRDTCSALTFAGLGVASTEGTTSSVEDGTCTVETVSDTSEPTPTDVLTSARETDIVGRCGNRTVVDAVSGPLGEYGINKLSASTPGVTVLLDVESDLGETERDCTVGGQVVLLLGVGGAGEERSGTHAKEPSSLRGSKGITAEGSAIRP